MRTKTAEQKAARKSKDAENRTLNGDEIRKKEQEYRDLNRSHIRERQMAYRTEHAEELKQYFRSLKRKKPPRTVEQKLARKLSENPVKSAEQARRWRLANAARFAAVSALYRQRPDYAERMRRFREKYMTERREQMRVNGQNYRASHKVQRASLERARIAKKKHSQGSATLTEILSLFELQHGKCIFFKTCGNHLNKTASRSSWNVDHIDPLQPRDQNRQTGKSSIDNLQLLCASCNRKKHNSDPYQFAQRNGLLFCDLTDVRATGKR